MQERERGTEREMGKGVGRPWLAIIGRRWRWLPAVTTEREGEKVGEDRVNERRERETERERRERERM